MRSGTSNGKGSLLVATAQIACRDDDLAANVETHLAAIDRARQAGAELLLFPELSLSGYHGATGASQRPDATILERLCAAAGGMAVSVGLPESEARRVYNTQLLLQDGAIRHRHRKINLPGYGTLTEDRHFASGHTVEPVQMGSWSVATLICADTWNPALPWLAALAGADLLLVPVASALDAVDEEFDQRAGWELNLRHTALTYGMPVMMANHAGPGPFWGGSCIFDAHGQARARAGSEPEICLARLSLSDIATARKRLPTIRDADPKLIESELRRRLPAIQRGADP